MQARIKVIQANDDSRHEYNISLADAPVLYVVEIRTLEGDWVEVAMFAKQSDAFLTVFGLGQRGFLVAA
jgi:hypothetical protein